MKKEIKLLKFLKEKYQQEICEHKFSSPLENTSISSERKIIVYCRECLKPILTSLENEL